jgi:phosphomevalonate kinase
MQPYAEVCAPGKLVLLGEYAVLDGAPALVIAIDRGVRCVLSSGDGIETPDGDTRFVAPALRGAPAARYQFSNWNPVSLPGKPGFGGSAAACVAACVAAGRPAADAFAIHHHVQGGGSGIDIAASIHGGAIRFQDRAVTPAAALLPSVIWSGGSARTGPRVRQYRAWADAAARRAFLQRSADVVDQCASDPVRAFRENGRLLRDMAVMAGIDYETPRLAGIRALAERFGGAAKPSGAGGGDCAVAVFPDPARRAAFEEACTTAGLTRIRVSLALGARRVPFSSEADKSVSKYRTPEAP